MDVVRVYSCVSVGVFFFFFLADEVEFYRENWRGVG